MTLQIDNAVITAILREIDLPDSAREKAEARYKGLGEWFGEPGRRCSGYNPRVYPQGSFRLGTVVRPLSEDDEYDLDMGCRLERGVAKTTHSQSDLKQMVGQDLEAYRIANRVHSPLDERNRCWRLSYKDQVGFHLDAVPSIPEEEALRSAISERMVANGITRDLANQIAGHAGAITDTSHPGYLVITPNWMVSNSEGYARWFESRIRQRAFRTPSRIFMIEGKSTVEELPASTWKSPLQQAIQVLKRHRDVAFKNDRVRQPISIIITTLAAHAYTGSSDVAEALGQILPNLEAGIRESFPKVPNPVQPEEDFADKWYAADKGHLDLEGTFRRWIHQVIRDLNRIAAAGTAEAFRDVVQDVFQIGISEEWLENRFGQRRPVVAPRPARHTVISEPPPKPWCA
jgi:hypothetical protein